MAWSLINKMKRPKNSLLDDAEVVDTDATQESPATTEWGALLTELPFSGHRSPSPSLPSVSSKEALERKMDDVDPVTVCRLKNVCVLGSKYRIYWLVHEKSFQRSDL